MYFLLPNNRLCSKFRNLIKFWIPSPFDGIAGFKHHFLRELNGNVLLAFSFLIFLRDSLREYIYNLYKLI